MQYAEVTSVTEMEHKKRLLSWQEGLRSEVAEIMQQRGIETQAEFAELIGRHQSWMSRALNPEQPSEYRLAKLESDLAELQKERPPSAQEGAFDVSGVTGGGWAKMPRRPSREARSVETDAGAVEEAGQRVRSGGSTAAAAFEIIREGDVIRFRSSFPTVILEMGEGAERVRVVVDVRRGGGDDADDAVAVESSEEAPQRRGGVDGDGNTLHTHEGQEVKGA